MLGSRPSARPSRRPSGGSGGKSPSGYRGFVRRHPSRCGGGLRGSCPPREDFFTIVAGFGQEADVSDFFYNYITEELTDRFGIDEPLSVSDWLGYGAEVKEIFEAAISRRVPLKTTDILYPFFE